MGDPVKISDILRVMNIDQESTHATDPPPQASWDLYEMIQAFLQAPSYHVYFEILLILCIARLILFTKSYKPARTVLTEKEKEELIQEWTPDPLVPEVSSDHPLLDSYENRLVHGKVGRQITINGRMCLNMATMNFLSMATRDEIEEATVASLRKYGVGSCGPRGFYGTVDVHLKLEASLAEFMGVEEAIIYSYGFATVASAIPAYSKRGDVIFADEGVHFAIQKGILASRSDVRYFKHNDVNDLERLLKIQEEDDLKNPKKARVTRRFLVIEGLYLNHADLCPLPHMVKLKHKYKVRIFLDESISFGSIGVNGRGVTEHYNVPISEIDLLSSSLEYSMAAIGGFCCGKAYVIDHQRLSGAGYCFSASCPPMLAQTAITALDIMARRPELLEKLKSLSEYAHEKFNDNFVIKGSPISPIMHLYCSPSINASQDLHTLRSIVRKAEERGLALTTAAYLEEELFSPKASIRIALSSDLEYEDIDKAVSIIQEVMVEVGDG